MEAYNVDVNARRADYQHLDDGVLLVSKIWKSIQGEGPFVGMPVVFVRLAGCNLGVKESCVFCDSEFQLARGHQLHYMAVAAHVDYLMSNLLVSPLVVLTGGEPLLQDSSVRLVEELLVQGKDVQIETNGYFWSDRWAALKTTFPSSLTVVVSPKVNQRKFYPNLPQGLQNGEHVLKFLVEADPESPYHRPPSYALPISWQRIYVSPIMPYRRAPRPAEERVCILDPDTPLDVEGCRRNMAWAQEIAQRLGFRLSLQTHLLTGVE